MTETITMTIDREHIFTYELRYEIIAALRIHMFDESFDYKKTTQTVAFKQSALDVRALIFSIDRLKNEMNLRYGITNNVITAFNGVSLAKGKITTLSSSDIIGYDIMRNDYFKHYLMQNYHLKAEDFEQPISNIWSVKIINSAKQLYYNDLNKRISDEMLASGDNIYFEFMNITVQNETGYTSDTVKFYYDQEHHHTSIDTSHYERTI